MISSTRSSESASRSSWNDASSDNSLSSTPSCSLRTDLTRSATSSRDSATCSTSRLERVPGARGLYHALRQSLTHQTDDVVLASTRRQPDRIRDRDARARPVRDDHDAPQTEQIRAPGRLRVEPRAQASSRWTDQEPPELAAPGRLDLCT